MCANDRSLTRSPSFSFLLQQQQQQGSAVSARLAVVYAAMCREALLVDDDGNSLHRSMYDVQPSQALVLLDLLRSEARLQHEQLGTRRQCGIEIARQRLPLMMWALGKQPALSVPPLLAHLDRLLATAPSSIDAMIKHEDEADTTTSTAEQCERELLAVIRTAVIAAYRTLARPWLATRSHRALSVVEEDDELFRLGERKSAQTAVHEYTRQLLQPSTAQSAYVVLRSAAVTHPDLLLRYIPLSAHIPSDHCSRFCLCACVYDSYLPVLGSLVDARGSDTEEFVTRGHHRVMMHVLGVVDALRPAVFQVRSLYDDGGDGKWSVEGALSRR